MDPNIKDESGGRRREELLARRVGEALDQAVERGAAPCPDAEMIAAFHERELLPEESARCEAHFATCSRCRKILAVLAATDDTPLAEKEVARLGELVAAVSPPQGASPQPAAPSPRKFFDWRVRWLAPALGVAAVLAVWFAIRPPWRTTSQSSTENLVAQGPRTEPSPAVGAPPADQISNSAPMKSIESTNPPALPKAESDAKAESAKPALQDLAKKSLDEARRPDGEVAANAGAAQSATGTDIKESLEGHPGAASGDAGGLAGGAPAPPPPAPAAAPRRPVTQMQPRAASQDSAGNEVPRSTAQSVTVTGEAPVVNSSGSAVDVPQNGRNYANLSAVNGRVAGTVSINSPDGTSLWRAGKGGTIERSTDTGKTWSAQTSPLMDDWLAGAAVSDTVAWIAGRNGAIARTTNGTSWKQIIPPTHAVDSGKSPDWMGITASSAQSATISASDGQRYTTRDGGKTWQAQ